MEGFEGVSWSYAAHFEGSLLPHLLFLSLITQTKNIEVQVREEYLLV